MEAKTRGRVWIGAGALLAAVSGAYATDRLYYVYDTNVVRNALELNEQRLDNAVAKNVADREKLNDLEKRATALKLDAASVPKLRSDIKTIDEAASTLQKQIKELEKKRNEFQQLLDAMQQAKDAALAGRVKLREGLERDIPGLAGLADWDRARPLVDALNDITQRQLEIKQRMSMVDVGFDLPSANKEFLRQQQDDLRANLDAATLEMKALDEKYAALVKEFQDRRDKLDADIALGQTQLKALQEQIAAIEKKIQQIQNELKTVTDTIVAVDEAEAARAALTKRIDELTPRIKAIDDEVSTQVKRFVEQSKALRGTLAARRDTILLAVRWHLAFLAVGTVGCWFVHWGLYLLGLGYYRRASKDHQPIGFFIIATVLVPPEKLRCVTVVKVPPRFVNWYAGIVCSAYASFLTAAGLLG